MDYSKPGCFGHAITFSLLSPTCRECEDMDECGKSARSRLDELSSVINVDAILRMSHKEKSRKTATAPVEPRFDADLSETAQRVIATLPDNAQRTAAALIRTKVNFRKVLLTGVNPIHHQKPLAVSVLFDLLLTGPVNRDMYLLTLKEVLGHSPAVAASQAAIGFTIATGLGIAELKGDLLTIRNNP